MKNKNILFILLVLCIVLSNNSCRKNQEKTEEVPIISGDLISVDVNVGMKEYFKRVGFEDENISTKLVPLETNDEFLYAGLLEAFTDSIIIFRNFHGKGGNILIFGGQGNALRKLSPGQSGEEYIMALKVVYDDNNKEIFVNDLYSCKIKVYGLDGEFKRALPYQGKVEYHEILNFDNESLICYTHDDIKNPVFLISRQTGEKLQDIIIPYKKRLTINQILPNGSIASTTLSLLKTHDGIIISEPSSDTIYHLSSEGAVLRPILYRTPPIQTMDIPVFVSPITFIDSALFVRIIKKEDENVRTVGFLMCDYKDRGIYQCIRTGLPMTNFGIPPFVIHETKQNVFLNPISADYLTERYKSNKLTGNAKEIASRLKDDDNEVMAIFTIQK
ncbi:MAG: 6-bladed beta-propeller [Dysgonamonadaceae bacterium]|nr:6-bladed beta-propeller [Dysgonamonadaceae bacterium]